MNRPADRIAPDFQAEALSRLAVRAGSRSPLWTQGAGGNVSLKDDKILWIKASGCRLDEVSPNRGIARVDRDAIADPLKSDMNEASYQQALQQANRSTEARPSMETGFHAVLPARWVIHLHSLPAILLADQYRRDPGTVSDWLGKQTQKPFRFLPLLLPGWELCRATRGHTKATFLLLTGHGIVLQDRGETDATEILSEWAKLEEAICERWSWNAVSPLTRAPSPLSVAQRISSQLGPAPRKVYFPDAIVFQDRVGAILTGTQENGFVLKPGAWNTDRDAAEVWLATQLLFHSAPQLPEIPDSMARIIAGLSSEQYRRQISRSREA